MNASNELRPVLANAARWSAFREMCRIPVAHWTREQEEFFDMLAESEKHSPEELDAAIDRAIPSIHPITEPD